MKNITNKAVILLSGGLDSAVSAYLYHKQGVELYGLTFVNRELGIDCVEVRCAKKIASGLGIRHKIADVSFLIDLVDDIPSLISSFKGVDENYMPPRVKVVPFGVEIMHFTAMFYAVSHDIQTIVWSIHLDDFVNKTSTENIKEYIGIIERISIRKRMKCIIETPLLLMQKTEIVSLGKELGIPFNDTFSCLVNTDEFEHCGKCERCLQRITAFQKLNRIERHVYEKSII
jgi:7-cyano-7-deazaguanine synthase